MTLQPLATPAQLSEREHDILLLVDNKMDLPLWKDPSQPSADGSMPKDAAGAADSDRLTVDQITEAFVRTSMILSHVEDVPTSVSFHWYARG